MFELLDRSSGAVLGFKVAGTIQKSDYDALDPEVERVVKQYGGVCLLLDMEEFQWEKVTAWGADFHFGHEFHEKTEKMAILGDKEWEKLMVHVVTPFYAKEARYFTPDARDDAWKWLES